MSYVPSTESIEENMQAPAQDASQETIMDAHLWASFIPCSSRYRRLDFWKLFPTCNIGRLRNNHFVLDGMKISQSHCEISWNGVMGPDSVITVSDFSLNGTFINGILIGKGRHALLEEGNEIAFGTCMPGPDDCRFVCRHLAVRRPLHKGIHDYYDFGREIGKGTYAIVIKARHRVERCWYAVKIVKSNNLRASSIIGKKVYEREIAILQRLEHPNICQLKDYFFEEPNIDLVLELVEGGNLLEYMINHGRIREPEAQHITYQICDALSYVHTLGIAHRDLKPEHILLTKDKPVVIKVAGFGLAGFLDDDGTLRTARGTPWYIAPEVFQQENDKGYDELVDSWSIGVIVFSMLAHDHPFTASNGKVKVSDWVRSRQVNWDILLQSRVSRHGEDFVRRLLESDPRERLALPVALIHPWLTKQFRDHGPHSVDGEPESAS